MIKIVLCGLIVVCHIALYSADNYTVQLKGSTVILFPKKILDQFPVTKRLLDSPPNLNFSGRSDTVYSFGLAMDVAQIIFDKYAAKTNNMIPEKLSYTVKSEIAKKFQNVPLEDLFQCCNLLSFLGISEPIQQFLAAECVLHLKKFVSQEKRKTLDLSNVDLNDQIWNKIKKEVIDVLSTSNAPDASADILTFSGETATHIVLPNTKDKRIVAEALVQYGNFYAYLLTDDKHLYVVNLIEKNTKDYEETPQPVMMEGKSVIAESIYFPSLYTAHVINKIVALIPRTQSIMLFFNGIIEFRNPVGILFKDQAKIALSRDGDSLLILYHFKSGKFSYELHKGTKVFKLNRAIEGFVTNLGGCSFNPTDSDTFLFYTNKAVHVISPEVYPTDNTYAIIQSGRVLDGFVGDIINVTFSNDGSCIYVVTKQAQRLLCYKFHYLEQTDKLILLSYQRENVEIINTTNSPDNDQFFIECRYNTGDQAPYPTKKYDLISFDFRDPKATILYPDSEQSFDVRSDDNLVVYKTKGHIRFYDCFFRKEIEKYSIDRCRSLLGFSTNRSLWLRMESASDIAIPSKKSDPDFLLNYVVRKQEFNDIKKGIENDNNFNFSEWLALLTTYDIRRKDWYAKAYELLLIEKDLVKEELKSKIQQGLVKFEAEKRVKERKRAKSEGSEPSKKKPAQPITIIQENVPAVPTTTAVQLSVPITTTAQAQQQTPVAPQTAIAPSPQPTPVPQPQGFFQQAWSTVKTLFNFITAPLRWFFGYA